VSEDHGTAGSPGGLIASALRDIGSQAALPGPMADACWRAGHRRRRRLLAGATAGAAAMAAVAVALPLGLTGGPATRPASGPPAVNPGRGPLQFRQVAAVSGRPCPAGSAGLPAPSGHGCIYLSSTGMTVGTVLVAQVSTTGTSRYGVTVLLRPAEAGRFAALTRTLAGQPAPRDLLAIVVDGRVVADPKVTAALGGGQFQISGLGGRAAAERMVHQLTGR
jgi:hypothetical protein